jgi:hypothetical protein
LCSDECKRKKGKHLDPDAFAYTMNEPSTDDGSAKGMDHAVVARWHKYISSTCVPIFHGWIVFVSKETKAFELVCHVLRDGGAEIAGRTDYSNITHLMHSSVAVKADRRGIPGPIKRRVSSLIVIQGKELLDAIAEGPPPGPNTWDQWRPVGDVR